MALMVTLTGAVGPVNQGLDAVKDPVAVEQELLLLMEALGVAG